MKSSVAVSVWIERLKAGDPDAAQRLWESYFHRLVGLARARLQEVPRTAADEEDVALSAFHSFCQGAAQGQFPLLKDRDDLWHLLVVLTARKALHLRRDQRRQKRGGGKVLTEADWQANEDDETTGLVQVIGAEPTPEFAAEVAEQCQHLLGLLGQEGGLRDIAVLKMEGHTNQEIAARLGSGLRTVERKLERIRILWQAEVCS